MSESHPEIVIGNFDQNPQGENPEKSPQLPTENLGKLKEIIGRYHDIQVHPELVNRDEINEVFQRHNLSPQDMVSPAGLGYQVNEGKLTAFLGGMFEEKRNALNAYFTSDEIEGQLVNAEKDFKDLHLLELLLNQTISSQDKEKSAGLLKLAQKTAKLTQNILKYWISKEGVRLFEEDALAGTNLPTRYKETGSEITKEPYDPLGSLRELAVVTCDPVLRREYQALVNPFYQDSYRLGGDGVYFPNFLKIVDINSDNYYLNRAIDMVRKSFSPRIDATPNQTHALYDVVEKRFFEQLFAGGRESWDGSEVAKTFSVLRDPRAIPGLIKHLRMFGSGHTSAVVVNTISNIVKQPLSREELNEVLAGLPLLERRVVNEWFINPASIVKAALQGNDGRIMAHCVQGAESHLAYGELVNLAAKIAETSGVKINERMLHFYFLGNFGEWRDGVDRVLLSNLPEVAKTIARSKIVDWRTTSPIIFNALVSPQNKDYFFFPGTIASEGLSLEPQSLEKLVSLYQSKDLQKGFLARAVFAEGLLFLTTKENGGEILESMLSVTQGTREDPSRIREIFQWMRALDNFGVFSFEPRGSLNEIVADLREKVVVAAKEKMEISEQEMPFLRERLNFLLENKAFEIIPALLAQYEKRSDNTKNVIREIGRHIILGDFKDWRNSLSTSEAQLAVLSEGKRQGWLGPASELRVTIKMQKEEEARRGAVEAIKRIVQESKAHIAEVYKLDFSEERIRLLKLMHDQLTKDLKDQTKDAEVKRELGMKKHSVDLELQVLEGMTGLESLSLDQLQTVKILEIISKTKNALNSLGSLEQAQQDLDQISQVLTTQKELASVEELKAYDSDDPFALLNAGTQPRETCQSWRAGSHNYCLPAYVADANKRVINVEGNNKEILARSVIKLTHLQGENDQKIPAILLEPIYTTSELPQIYQAVVRMALTKAKAAGAVLVVSGEKMVASGSDHSHTIPLLSTEAKKNGFRYEEKDVQIFIPKSFNTHEYSDSLGGDISWFENYHPLKNAVIITPV